MKYAVFLLFGMFIFFACSTGNQMVSGNKDGLKTLRLDQSAQVQKWKAKDSLSHKSTQLIQFNYLYEEKSQDRPVMTLHLKMGKLKGELSDSLLFINLDGESILLPATNNAFVIAENLWVPIVHAQNIHYQMHPSDNPDVIKLTIRQRDQLIEFFKKAIQRRDKLFPAIPEGQKKW